MGAFTFVGIFTFDGLTVGRGVEPIGIGGYRGGGWEGGRVGAQGGNP